MRQPFQRWRTGERGFSNAIVFVFLMPLIVGMMGLAFDTARMAYMRERLEGYAQMSVQGAINQATNNATGNIVVDNLGPISQQIYCANTADMRANGLLTGDCNVTTGSFGSVLVNTQFCLIPTETGYTEYGITLTATEQIQNVFLSVLGPSFKTATFDKIDGRAKFRARNC